MAYIRDKDRELTGYQEASPYTPSIDLECDFVMVYGIDPDMPTRVKRFRDAGYVVHLMTGVSWGGYQDYLNGEIDGRQHWDESQRDRHGKDIIHNPTIPYMVPTIAFTDYLTEKLKVAVDAKVEALHLEEPEFWDAGGYSEAFKREYAIYYRKEWSPPHSSLDAMYKCARLKAYLYARAISRISAALKEYAMAKYGSTLRFYVPTHSLLNYTQWKIVSPEAALIDIPTVDGCIAQVWTGTSRTVNMYAGALKERTFETAYLEYGIMQELVKGTGRRMWFLNDPIEDNPGYTWENFQYNYMKTAVASLMHPQVHHYEICPWPHRVFDGIYPRVQPNIASKDETSYPAPDAKSIPQSYSTQLSGMFQLFGDMDQPEYSFEGDISGVGVFMSDSGLFQRTFPDGATDNNPLLDFIQSGAFPQFYGMTLPLLKYGLPVRPVQLDNVRRFPGYLRDYSALILSYEYIKPESPDVNVSLAAWVNAGGTLIYVGDGSDPFHAIDAWWRDGGYENPGQHLFEALGLPRDIAEGTYSVGSGCVAVKCITPATICLSAQAAQDFRVFVEGALRTCGQSWIYANHLTIRRGPYVISAVMDESISDCPKHFTGLFSDIQTQDFAIVTEKIISPDEHAILFDYAKLSDGIRIIGTSARVFSLDVNAAGFEIKLKTADKIKAFTRIRLPNRPMRVSADVDVDVLSDWDENTRTLLISYDSVGAGVTVRGQFSEGIIA